MRNASYDVVVIGGGTAGLAAAKRCASHRLKVALIERGRLGGECLWTGCIPAKTMLNSASVYHLMQRAGEFGLPEFARPVDWARVVRAKDEVVDRIAQESSPEVLAAQGVDTFQGAASFRSPHEVTVGGRVIVGRNIVVATGSRQAELRNVPGLREVGYITHVDAVTMPRLPRRIAVIGAGPVGVEFAQMFGRLGAEVIVMERSDMILSQEDPEISAYLEHVLTEEGLCIIHDCSVRYVRGAGEAKALGLEDATGYGELIVEEILLATGRVPNLEELNLEAAGVQVNKRGIVVDEYLRSSVPHIYACGDVSGQYLFSHVAEYQAGVAAHNIAFLEAPIRADYRIVPWATFTDPQVGHVGLTEPQAREAGYEVKVERFYLSGLDRALTLRQAQGMVKVVAEAKSGRILGAHIVAPNASNLIHEYVLAMKAGIPLREIADTMHAYPTLSEAVKAAAAKF